MALDLLRVISRKVIFEPQAGADAIQGSLSISANSPNVETGFNTARISSSLTASFTEVL